MQLSPEAGFFAREAALVLYYAGRLDEALPLYERALALAPEGRLQPVYMMQLGLTRRKAGDEEGAQTAAQLAMQDHAAARAGGQNYHMLEALIAAFEHNPDRAFAALQSAIQNGLRWAMFFDDPIFEDLRDNQRFVALRHELDAILAEEHSKILQLICFNNPVPDEWQPMPETCEGAVHVKGPEPFKLKR
jgi:tetratricopeptide (TPR) repeat protein